MEELTEVITAAEFHPTACHLFVYSSSKGTIRLCDMRTQAICDKHSKCKSTAYCYCLVCFSVFKDGQDLDFAVRCIRLSATNGIQNHAKH